VSRKLWWKLVTWGWGNTWPLAIAASFSQSITPAMSMLLGQRVVQVSQEEHTQMVRQPKTWAS
jgi:hypothetical protein